MAYLDSVFSCNKVLMNDKVQYATLLRQTSTEDPNYAAYYIFLSSFKDYKEGYSMHWRTQGDSLEEFYQILQIYETFININSKI